MPDFTKHAIQESFIRLLNMQPLKQITIRDIVEECGINRNTFYYHFKDLPDLIESILVRDVNELVLNNKNLDSVEDCLNVVVDTILRNKSAVLHLYKSANRDYFEQYHWKICTYIVSEYLNRQLGDAKISKNDRRILIYYIRSLLFGIVMSWLRSDLEDDIQFVLHRICELKQGDFDLMLNKCILAQ